MMHTVKPLTNTRTFLLWLVLFCPVAAWIGWQDHADRRERFLQDTSIAQRMLSQKTVQHEAVLATLAALSHPPDPERLLPSLQPSMPQLLGRRRSKGRRFLFVPQSEGSSDYLVGNHLLAWLSWCAGSQAVYTDCEPHRGSAIAPANGGRILWWMHAADAT